MSAGISADILQRVCVDTYTLDIIMYPTVSFRNCSQMKTEGLYKNEF